MLLLLGATTAIGLAGMLAGWLWPAGCALFSCSRSEGGPPPFTGGWVTQGQFLMWLVLLFPFLATSLLSAFRRPRSVAPKFLLGMLTAGAILGFVMGADVWGWAVALIGGLLVLWRLWPLHRDGERLVFKALAFGALFAAVMVYGIAPGYLQQVATDLRSEGSLRIGPSRDLPRVLSSEQVTLLSLTAINTGWGVLGDQPPWDTESDLPSTSQRLRTSAESGALQIGVRLHLNTRRGLVRSLDLPPLILSKPLQPGRSRPIDLPVRLPPWVREGYLTWWARDFHGKDISLSSESQGGFRFINGDFKRLELDPENRMTAFTQRARAFAGKTLPLGHQSPDPDSLNMVLGDLLDTLVFSPLWGKTHSRLARQTPFNANRPFWADIFHRAGFIGLGLAFWIWARLFLRTIRIAERIPFHQSPVWQFLPISLVLLGLIGFISNNPASFHGVWAFFLLSGWVDGRYEAIFPRPLAQKIPRSGLSLNLPFFRRRKPRTPKRTRPIRPR